MFGVSSRRCASRRWLRLHVPISGNVAVRFLVVLVPTVRAWVPPCPGWGSPSVSWVCWVSVVVVG
jgi:hypothetical protein